MSPTLQPSGRNQKEKGRKDTETKPRSTGNPNQMHKREIPAPSAVPSTGSGKVHANRPECHSTPAAKEGPSGSSESFEENLRRLPIPEPYDKVEDQEAAATRYARPWTWTQWKSWMSRCWDRGSWRQKNEINRVLQLRAKEPANKQIYWRQISQRFNDCGVIYGIYHFTSGRWYVGQTINEVYRRAQSHWWARFRDLDLFHEALSLEEDPHEIFSFVQCYGTLMCSCPTRSQRRQQP